VKKTTIALLLALWAVTLPAADLDGVWLLHDGRDDGAELTLTVDPAGTADATVAGIALSGALTGNQLTLHGTTPAGPEVWMAWVGLAGGQPAYLSGVIHLADGTTQGWYAVRTDEPAPGSGARVAPAAESRVAPVPLPTALPVAEPHVATMAAPEPTPVALAPPVATPRTTTAPPTASDSGFEGLWRGPFHTYTIVRDGSSLTITGSDGSTANGRVTGPQTLVAGLRPGCCRGAVTTPDMIVWQDDSVWRRVEE
jgi:hypothetical protein